MKEFKYVWLVGLVVTALIVVVPIVLATAPASEEPETRDPWDYVPSRVKHTDHSNLFSEPLETGSDVTRACLNCHPDAGEEMLHNVHWTWKASAVNVPWRDEPVATGKANVINNFCIGVQGNWPGCTRCHAGYGWEDENFDFSNEENIDCLVCHDQTGTYVKSTAGQPAEGVDLLTVAENVGMPTRQTCGKCHFNGGGGNAVKHGDLDETLYYPSDHEDVHMGRYDFQCIDCHQGEDHQFKGRSISVSVDNANQVYCTDCHDTNLHEDERISRHLDTVACQTCHIPRIAVRTPTKVYWDWSTAGQDWPESTHEYLKIKGSFIYEGNFIPEYHWYNGTVESRYLLGDPIDPNETTVLNEPAGDIRDPNAKIFPFKVHYAKQIYDVVYRYLLQPKTVGEGGYWTEFDWDLAAQLGAEAAGLKYSGQYDFAPTAMYWPITHLVTPAEHALQCVDCHSPNGRMDWEALGYYGDPMRWGGRQVILEAEAEDN